MKGLSNADSFLATNLPKATTTKNKQWSLVFGLIIALQKKSNFEGTLWNSDSFLATNLLYGGGVGTHVNQVPPHQRLPKGGIQQLRGPNFTKFQPPPPPSSGQKWICYIQSILCHVTPRGLYLTPSPSSCPRSYWMTPNKKIAKLGPHYLHFVYI